jgi:hypothetical protein
VTDTTAAAILAHARYIAVDRQEPIDAQRWLESAWDPACIAPDPHQLISTEEVRRRIAALTAKRGSGPTNAREPDA